MLYRQNGTKVVTDEIIVVDRMILNESLEKISFLNHVTEIAQFMHKLLHRGGTWEILSSSVP